MSGAFEFILAGMLVGFCVGITGVGGGSLMTPILIGLLELNLISRLVPIYFMLQSQNFVDQWFTLETQYCLANCFMVSRR